jgi:hypothetical protein
MERSLNLKRRPYTRFLDGCRPKPEALQEILASIALLARDPNHGYRILFVNPPIFQIRVGPYAVNYVFDDTTVTVLYLGIIGRCP